MTNNRIEIAIAGNIAAATSKCLTDRSATKDEGLIKSTFTWLVAILIT
jgi:hypothetical protein